MKRIMTLSLASLALPFALIAPASDVQAKGIDDNVAQVSLIPGWRLPSGNHMAALRVTMAPGWHTYWRAPGAAGIPPRFEWTGSSPLADVDFHWPIPTVYEQNGMRFAGYEDELILPIEFTPAQAGDTLIKGHIDMGVCREVCLPYEATFKAVLSESATKAVPQIQAALKQKPQRLSDAHCSAQAIDDGMVLRASVQAPQIQGLEMVVLEHPDPSVWVSTPITKRDGVNVSLESDLVPANGTPFFVDRSSLTLTIIGDGTAYEAQGCTGG